VVAPSAFAAWLRPLQEREWVVYAKPRFAGPEQVLKYLARYTHRGTIGNRRLLSCDGQRVTLTAEEFVRRWLQDVLPRGFVKMRRYSLLGNRGRLEWLAVCRTLPPLGTVVQMRVRGWAAEPRRPAVRDVAVRPEGRNSGGPWRSYLRRRLSGSPRPGAGSPRRTRRSAPVGEARM
jgi:hypothetical protein